MRLSLILLLLTSTAYAVTPCNVTDAGFKMGPTIRTTDGGCLVWFCSNNHSWDTYWLCSAYGGITGAVIDHLNGLTQASQAQRDSEWAALVATQPAAGSAEDRLVKAAALTPTPTDIPLDGWVTQDTKLYKRQDALNGYTLAQVGTVGLGLVCDAKTYLSDANGVRYYAVNRDDPTIKYTKVGLYIMPKPIAAYARCN
jgi:hypothetical protein